MSTVQSFLKILSSTYNVTGHVIKRYVMLCDIKRKRDQDKIAVP